MVPKTPMHEIRSAIRHILMADWDPIGVCDLPEAADEYDDYINEVLELLNRNATDEQLAQHLLQIETKRMGLTDVAGGPLLTVDHLGKAVSALQSLKGSHLVEKNGPSKRRFRHWTLYSKFFSPAFAKTQARRVQGLCIGCRLNPCKCKNPRRKH